MQETGLVGEPEDMRPLTRPRRSREDNNKRVFKNWGRQACAGLIWLRI